MKKNLTCIICPCGCALEAEILEDGTVRVSGATCKRGEAYAASEISDPVRTVTSTVPVTNRSGVRCSVKTAQPISKARVFELMDRIHAAGVEAPVRIGDVILPDVYGTDLVATENVL